MNAKNIAKKIVLVFSAIRLIPHILLLKCHPSRKIIELDIERWSKDLHITNKASGTGWSGLHAFIQLMTFYKYFSYRNLFYYRLGWTSRILYPLCRPMPLLDISLVDEGIGPGFLIMHGRASSVAAKKVGKNCTIYQHVTIGYINENDKPVIGDNVVIYAGAKVLGDITVGNNSKIGANAVVTKDVPDNSVVITVPPRTVRRSDDSW